MLKILNFSLLLFLMAFNMCEAKTYSLRNDPIDVIIPAVNKDTCTLPYCIKSIKQYVKNIRRIIIVSNAPLTKEAEWFDENLYPFSKEDIAFYLNGEDPYLTQTFLSERPCRVGWYYQQLLKLYVSSVIPDISTNILIVDSDTIFLQPLSFLNAANGGLYNTGTENHVPYFVHAAKLIPNFTKVFPEHSGICHHMLFQKEVLDDLFYTVENANHIEFWKAFCLHVDPEHLRYSGASEYEIYFNFVFSRTDQVQIRQMRWANKPPIPTPQLAKQTIWQARSEGFDYISCHNYE